MKKILLFIGFCSTIFLGGCFLNNPKKMPTTKKEGNEIIKTNQQKDIINEQKNTIDKVNVNSGSNTIIKFNKKKEKIRDEFNEEGEFDPKKFQDDDIDDVMGLLKDLLSE